MKTDILLSAALSHDPDAMDDADGALDALDAGANRQRLTPGEYSYTDAVYLHTVGEYLAEIPGEKK